MLAEDLRDVSGLGGLPLFAMTGLFAWTIGENQFVRQLIAGLSCGYIAVWLLRLVHFRPRPDGQPFTGWLQRFDANSFPSVHAMRGAVLWCLVAAHTHNLLLAVTCSLAIVLIAGSRVWLGRHHGLDVVVGVLVGLAAAGLSITGPDLWRALAGGDS